MSQDVENRDQFHGVLGAHELVCALFYASWCPFSRRFLPEFERAAGVHEKSFACVKVDDLVDLCDEYAIDVYPTVIFFEKGKVLDRVDGVLGAGIDVGRFSKVTEKCVAGKAL